ncbi:hypothetical protein HAX54_022604 [Datura stramonium]|uniref:Protein kinase domain-containing protein n=1 Tax=Datura stramonium TaxID=4076 RepID=A0ABS8S521_DATST|nr:hypothetical protein [Datura stramonium]
MTLNVTVKMLLGGNKDVSKDYGLFITYPMRPGENLSSIALATNTSSRLIQMYNPMVNFSAGSGLLYILGEDYLFGYDNVAAVVMDLLFVKILFYPWIYLFYADKLGNYPPIPTSKGGQPFPSLSFVLIPPLWLLAPKSSSSGKIIAAIAVAALAGVSLLIGIIYVGIYRKKEQKVGANIPASSGQSHSPGPGGFGAVYYAELRGKKAAIKRMNRQGSAEFLAELRILTHVHHLNLVSLIVLSNILINKDFHAKIGDFGLAKLVQSGNPTLHSRFVGTFGYMPPEENLSQELVHQNVSKPIALNIDSKRVENICLRFGVVLYELISSKEAIVKEGGVDEPRSLVTLMAQLAKACTEKDPQMRPTMKSVVVALMALSSDTI